ncbi:MAG: protein kinase [Myxococcales bacterium]|nr:protein kinase [Myxococcales bacterium]
MQPQSAGDRSLRDRVVEVFFPARDLGREEIERLEHERQHHNLRRARLYAPLLLAVHVGIATGQILVTPSSPAEAYWRSGLVTLHAAMIPLSLFVGVVAFLPDRKAPFLQRRVGEMLGIPYAVWGALLALNAQRIHTAINPYVMAILAVAVGVRLRVLSHSIALFGALGVLLAGYPYVQPHDGIRRATSLTAMGFTLIAFGIARSSFSALVREVRARVTVERANETLERRVAEQVSEIVARAKEIEQLNFQLDEKVKERSRELSVALSRLAEAHAVAPPLPSGTVLGDRVVIERPLGFGGMGVVYRGHDRVIDRPVAIKMVQAATAQELDGLYRFLREASAAASVRHPAIVRSLHVDVSEDGRLFQILELVEGETLAARLGSEPALPVTMALRIGATLAGALAAAHAAGIVHRDVKPSNVMLTSTAPGLKLLDFGVSKLHGALPTGSTRSGAIVGTPEYMAPEQILDPEHAGEKVDVYATGLIVYQALVGRLPFQAKSPAAWMRAHAETVPEPLVLDAGAPAELAGLVMQCLCKDPAARPSAAEVATAFGVLADACSAQPLEEQVSTRTVRESALPGPVGPLSPTLVAGTTGPA